jgi:hypothetical protein
MVPTAQAFPDVGPIRILGTTARSRRSAVRKIVRQVAVVVASALVVVGVSAGSAAAAGQEEYNGCRRTVLNPCERRGTCSIQGSSWYATASIDRRDPLVRQGWAGLCDMMHVALVRGNCSPAGSQVDVTMRLSSTSSAFTPQITGTLRCAG